MNVTRTVYLGILTSLVAPVGLAAQGPAATRSEVLWTFDTGG